jgi:SHS family sialic acid transporter-like MFS transporter
MASKGEQNLNRGKWLALAAALLGWMFDGLEMGLFPLVARPALMDLLKLTESNDQLVGRWMAVATASFLVGAATGGVLFGWLGDRIGRVRAMTLSVLTYAVFSGLCGVAKSAEQVAGLRFLSALGMGGEWSLGVALVMEIWPDRSRGWLAGLIGAAANAGYLLIGVLGLVLGRVLSEVHDLLLKSGMPESWVASLVAHSGWRLLMLMGAAPALLTFFIRLLVPESARWQEQQSRGTTSHWASRDLLGIGLGAVGACAMIWLWAVEFSFGLRLVGSAFALVIVLLGYTYPVMRYLQRAGAGSPGSTAAWGATLNRMFVGACLSGVALLGTWASIQWAPTWADQLTAGKDPEAKVYTQMASASGAIVGTIGAALLGNWLGRRLTYVLLSLSSLASAFVLFRLNDHYGTPFLLSVCLAGCFTASFYGWLPLYLPELFHTSVRATGQGFSFNFGRILAAVGALQTGNLMSKEGWFQGDYSQACSAMSLIYLVGLAVIWLAPETRGKALPD